MGHTAVREDRALSRLAFDELGRAAGGIGATHRAIAARAFAAPGAAGRPARLLHDAVAGTVYGALSRGSRVAGLVAEAVLSRRQAAHLSTTRRGAAVLAAINGLIGDALEAEGSELAIAMGVRLDGRPVPPAPQALREAFPGATDRVVVFLHGLMECEHAWALGGREPYGERLARELGWTPVYLRYNSGLPIAENGRALDGLLEALVAKWPVPVRELALVGHSMGGLVARSACHAAEGSRWPARVRTVVSLGSPYGGAPLERAVDRLTAQLARLPETEAFGSFFSRRSAGIRDLRRGVDLPPLETARHCYVSAGRDVLVMRGSAVPLDGALVHHLPGAGHLALLNNDAVYEQLRDWLQAR